MHNPRAATGRRRATIVAGTMIGALGASALTALPAAAVPAPSTEVSIDVDGDYALDAAHGWIKNGANDFGVVGNAIRLANPTLNTGITQLVSPRLGAAAGEPASGAEYDEFDARFTVASETGGFQPGLRLEVSPDNGNGARTGGSFVLYHNPATSKLEIGAIWTELGEGADTGDWYSKVLASVDPAVAHDIRLRHHFVVGGQDRVEVFVDGTLVGIVGTYEEYAHEFAPGAEPGTINSLLFRNSRSIPSANGVDWDLADPAPATEGHGFLLTNVGYSVRNSVDEKTVNHTTEQNIGAWDTRDTRANGHYELAEDGLRVWTSAPIDGSTNKSAGYLPFVRDLDLIGDPTWDVTKTSGELPGKQLGVDLDNDGAPDGYLVKEDNFPFWWLGNASNFAKTSPATPKNASEPAYRQLQGTLAQWKRAFPDAKTTQVGYSLGSGAIGDAVIHSMTFGDTTFSFGRYSCDATSTQVVRDLSGWASDSTGSGASVIEGDALHVTTLSGTAKQARILAVDESLRAVGEPAITWKNTDPASSTAQPGVQLRLDVDGNGTWDGTLVGEPKHYGNDWWLPGSGWYAAALKNAAPSSSGGFGSDKHGTLAQWAENLEKAGVEARVIGIGYSLGTGPVGDGSISSLSYGCNAVTFREKAAAVVAADDVDLTFGQSRTVRVRVTANETATGMVSVEGWGAPAALVGGVATFQVPTDLAVGTHQVALNYSGDANVKSATGALTVEVVKQSSAVVTFGGSVTEGQSYALPVTVVASSTPTGTVSVTEAGAPVASADLTSGRADVSLGELSRGTHTFTVTYGGSATVAGSSTTTTVVVGDRPAPRVYDSAVVAFDTVGSANKPGALLVQVAAPGAPAVSGTVTIKEGSRELAHVSVTGARSEIALPGLTAGKHTLSVAFESATSNVRNSSTTAVVDVAKAGSSTTAVWPATLTYGKSASVSVAIGAANGLAATGKVEVREGTKVLAAADLTAGAAKVVLPATLTAGTHALTAVYVGTSQIASSASVATTITVAQASSSVTATWPTKATFGKAASVSVQVKAANGLQATGKVEVREGTKVLATASLKAGAVKVALPKSLAVGAHKLTVAYVGTSQIASSSSAAKAITVAKASSSVTATWPTKATYGKAAKVSVKVTAANGVKATGKVEVREGKTVLAKANLKSGAATVALPKKLVAGSHKLKVVYVGSAKVASSSTAKTVKVAKATSKVSYKLGAKRTVVVTVSVAGISETGKVQLVVNPAAKGAKTVVTTASVKAGKATIVLPRVAYGTYDVSVKYLGTKDVKSSKSKVRTLVLS